MGTIKNNKEKYAGLTEKKVWFIIEKHVAIKL